MVKSLVLIFNELSKLGQGNLLFKTGLDISEGVWNKRPEKLALIRL
jgi:hypothetical protein